MSDQPSIWGIDADIIAYSVGFASENDPVDEAILSTRSLTQAVMDGCSCQYAQLFLTGKDNYRHEFASDYKGNRSDVAKPRHLEAIKEYMVSTLDAIVSDGQEADDELGIHAVQEGWGIASLDKDLDGVPGWHYVWKGKREGLYHVSEVEADRFFYTQMLTGDSTDNIQGLFNRTGKKAMPAIKAPLGELDSPADMYKYVLSVYMDAVAERNAPSDQADVERWLLEQGRCLWIRREAGQIWEPPCPSE